MSAQPKSTATHASTHALGVLCALTAGVWLGAAEAPTKLVNSDLSPYCLNRLRKTQFEEAL